MHKFYLLFGFVFSFPCLLSGQGIGEYLGDESVLYAETKQINQFFRRFNGEEDEEGNRYYQKDDRYQDTELRKKYLKMLFDNQNPGFSNKLKSEFANEITSDSDPVILDFHGGDWFAEVNGWSIRLVPGQSR